MDYELKCKKLEDMSFEDLYVEIPEQTYPELRAAISEGVGKLHIKWEGMRIRNACKRLFHAPLLPRARANH